MRREKNPRTEYLRLYYAANPDRSRARHLRRRFGITIAEYDAMWKKQRGKCAICRRRSPTKFRLSVDHDHQTLVVRGLLCLPCNRVVGYLDNAKWMKAALKYLHR